MSCISHRGNQPLSALYLKSDPQNTQTHTLSLVSLRKAAVQKPIKSSRTYATKRQTAQMIQILYSRQQVRPSLSDSQCALRKTQTLSASTGTCAHQMSTDFLNALTLYNQKHA
eukprot:1097026-Pelagomonas_calceolata.AAC.1